MKLIKTYIDDSSTDYWIMRSAGRDFDEYVGTVQYNGTLDVLFAYYTFGFIPVCVIC